MTDGAPLTTVVRAFDVIEVLWRIDGGGVSDVARELDLPKSTTHEYLTTLAAAGVAVNEGGTYRLSLKLLAIGSRIQYRKRLFHVSRPELVKLAETTGQAANVTIEERGRAVILASEGNAEGVSLGTYPGLASPMHSLAAGKVILAHRPRSFVESVIDEHGLEAVTAETITDRGALFEELDEIEARGHAVDRDEHVVGMGVVAAPIDHDGEVIGSVTVVCPTTTLADEDRREALVEAARDASKVIAFNYQYGP